MMFLEDELWSMLLCEYRRLLLPGGLQEPTTLGANSRIVKGMMIVFSDFVLLLEGIPDALAQPLNQKALARSGLAQ